MKVRKVRTPAYHAMSNGMVERCHRVLYGSIAHYIDSTGTNWDIVLPFLWLTEQHRTVRHITVHSIYYMVERWFYQTREI